MTGWQVPVDRQPDVFLCGHCIFFMAYCTREKISNQFQGVRVSPRSEVRSIKEDMDKLTKKTS